MRFDAIVPAKTGRHSAMSASNDSDRPRRRRRRRVRRRVRRRRSSNT